MPGKTDKQAELEKMLPPRKELTLWPHQKECIDILESQPAGSKSLVTMATGLGKTGTFTHIPDHGEKTLILSAGQEIVLNPLQYYDCPVGVEMGDFRAKRDFPDARVISASVQSIVRRLDDYDPYEFRNIIVDEAHHSPAPTYRAVIEHFHPHHLIGFTATPKRTDGIGLNTVYDKLVFNRDLKWAIKNDILCDIYCRTITIDVDLRGVRTSKNGIDGTSDFIEADLAKAMAHCAPALVDIYHQYAFGPTIINVASVAIANEVAASIPNAVAVTGQMKMEEREAILNDFRQEKIPCLVSVGVLREGVDLPCTQTVIMARPTISSVVYTQIVGRGLRKYKDKKCLNLIDIKGILGSNVTLCSAPTLMGIDMSTIPEKDKPAFNNQQLTDMEDIAQEIMTRPESWLLSSTSTQLWADTSGYDLHNVNWLMMPDGSFEVSFPTDRKPYENYKMVIPPPDALGQVRFGHVRMPAQLALDMGRIILDKNFAQKKFLWDRQQIDKKWGSQKASDAQKKIIRSVLPDTDFDTLNKFQASNMVASILKKKQNGKPDETVPIQIVNPDAVPKYYRNVEDISDSKQESFLVYDYSMGPNYPIDASKELIAEGFSKWLVACVKTGYQKNGEDIDKLIDSINASNLQTYGILFLKNHPRYQYLASLDGVPVTRRDLMSWLAELADSLIPRIIDAYIIAPQDGKTYANAHPDMKQEPFSRIKLRYPTSIYIINGTDKNMALPKVAQEIRRRNMELWAKKEKEKETKKKKHPSTTKRDEKKKKKKRG